MNRTLGVCKCCKRLCAVTRENICLDCIEKQEDRYHIVKNYLYDNRGATINTVAEDCDVSKSSILRWLREEKIEVMENSAVKLKCINCYTNILTGLYCYECKKQLEAVGRIAVIDKKKKKMKAFGKSRMNEDKMRFF